MKQTKIHRTCSWLYLNDEVKNFGVETRSLVRSQKIGGFNMKGKSPCSSNVCFLQNKLDIFHSV